MDIWVTPTLCDLRGLQKDWIGLGHALDRRDTSSRMGLFRIHLRMLAWHDVERWHCDAQGFQRELFADSVLADLSADDARWVHDVIARWIATTELDLQQLGATATPVVWSGVRSLFAILTWTGRTQDLARLHAMVDEPA
jgi:hypothetical protein